MMDLEEFSTAIEEYGLPSRIRTDRGENVLVAQFILEHPKRGPDARSVIVGRSVHNQRIERLWRDLYSSCISFFYLFFNFLKAIFLSCPTRLQQSSRPLCYPPIISACYTEAIGPFQAWLGNHPLRTEGNRTPLQLWIIGLANAHQKNPSSREATSVLEV